MKAALIKRTILMITKFFPPVKGGTESYSYDLARGLKEIGQEVVVIAPEAPGFKVFDQRQNFTIIRFKDSHIRLLRLWRMFHSALRYLKRNKLDVFLATSWSPGGVVAYLLNKKNYVSYFVINHGTELYAHRPWNWLRGKVFRSAAGVISSSNFTRERLARIGVPSSRISLIPPAVDLRRFQKQTDPLSRSRTQKIPILLTVARLSSTKGIDTVLQTLPEVKKRIRNLKYIVVGQGEDQKRLKKMAADLKLSDSVEFVGRVGEKELVGYYQLCDLFVLVSREGRGGTDYEGFGIVFLEAAACGKPVVGGKSGGIPEAVEDGVTGILVDPLNKQEISRAIVKILNDQALAHKMGEKGRQRVEEKFSYLSQARRFQELL